jgi:chromosome segregation ATPase
MVVESSAAGLSTDCPVCSSPIEVPHSDSPAEPDLPKPASEPVAPPKRSAAQGGESELAEARAEIARQNSLFKKALEECERLKANATHIQAELKSFQADRQQLKADLAQARHQAVATERRASELTDSLSAAHEEAKALRYQAEVDAEAYQRRIAELEAYLTSSQQETSGAKGEHTDALRLLAKTRAELTKIGTEAFGLRSEVEVLRNDFESATRELGATSQRLSEVEAQLQSVTEEHDQASTERDDWRQRAEGFHQDLTALDSGRDLLELRAQHAELQRKFQSLEVALAERNEAANKETEVLRGIVDRQNATLGVQHSELRSLRRSRFGLRLVQAIFSLSLVALGFLAFYVFAPQQFQGISNQIGQYLKAHGIDLGF